MIKRAFIITLLESQLSKTLGNDCFNQAKKFGMDPEIFPAINGVESQKYFDQEGIRNLLHKKIKALNGVKGCFLSHYFLWKKCIELNEPICILEHDGYFVRPLPLDVEDNFVDVLNLDPCPQYNDLYNDHVLKSLEKPIEYFKPTTTKLGAPQKSAKAGTYVGGAYGYCIKPHAAAKLIDFAKNTGALPADKHMGQNVVDITMTSSTIVRLHPYYSIENFYDSSTTKNLENLID